MDHGENTVAVHPNHRSRKGKIRVAHILEATFGGTRKHLMYLATRLDRSRYDVTVVCSTLRNPSFIADIELLLKRGVHVKVIQMARRIHPLSDCVALIRLYLFLRKGSYDIVHAHSSKAGFLGRIAARLARVPVVMYSPHAFSFHRGILGTQRRYLLLERFAAMFTDTIVAVSGGERDIAVNFGIKKSDDVVTIKNGVDLSEFDISIDAGALRKQIGLADARNVVGMVGRVCTQKGYRYFIEAAHEVSKVRPDVRFVLVGNGELDRALARIDGYGIRNLVVLTGQRTDVPALYALFDLVVVPSLWEGLPYVVLEAMAMRKPVVATRISGNAEVVLHGETGCLVPPGDAGAIANAVLDILSDAGRAAAMGERGRDEIERSYMVGENISSFERLYDEAVRRGRGR